jgi:hypothetical protein
MQQIRHNDVHQSAYFSTAKGKGHVPFLDHQMLECDFNGREYTNVDHDITLRIPEGAVAEGEKIHFEVGVAMYGPFIFPDNTQPISPILWLCVLDENVKLNKTLEIILPHCYTGSVTTSRISDQISFAVSEDITKDSNYEPHCLLQLWETDTKFYTDQKYGAIQTSLYHHQFFCIVKHKAIGHWSRDISFLLARVDLGLQPSQIVQEVHFYGLFDLATHRKVCWCMR